jgi:uncharacterized damage-inducible protein DinB
MEIERRTLEPLAGFSGELSFYLSNLETLRKRLREIVSDLTPDELAARAIPGAHQIGNLILHLGETEASWTQRIIDGAEPDDAMKKFSHWCDTTERDFAEKGYSAAECLERITRIRAKSMELFADFTDADLDKFFGYNRNDGTRVEFTLRWFLNNHLDHEAVHRGQISMLKRILRGGEI